MNLTSFLTNPYVILPTISLVVQLIVLGLLIYGYWLFRRLMFKQHGSVMGWAIVLHFTAIFGIMVPSFVIAVAPFYILKSVFGFISIVSLVHVPLGIAAASLGVWFVIGWKRQGLKGCFNRKLKMRYTLILWLVSIILGMTLYALFYWNLLMG